MINGSLFTIPYAYRNFCFILRCGIDSMRLVFHLVLVAVIEIDHKTKNNNNLHSPKKKRHTGRNEAASCG